MSQATFRFPLVHRQESVRVTSDSDGEDLVVALRADLTGRLPNYTGADGVTTLYLQSEAGTTAVTGDELGDGSEAAPSEGSQGASGLALMPDPSRSVLARTLDVVDSATDTLVHWDATQLTSDVGEFTPGAGYSIDGSDRLFVPTDSMFLVTFNVNVTADTVYEALYSGDGIYAGTVFVQAVEVPAAGSGSWSVRGQITDYLPPEWGGGSGPDGTCKVVLHLFGTNITSIVGNVAVAMLGPVPS